LSSKSKQFADTFVAMTYMSKDEVAQWGDSFNTVSNKNERNEAYEQFKRTKEAQVIEKLAERFPLLKSAIKNVYSSTPLTFRDYLGTPEGELYGIEKNFTNPTGTIINSKTKIENAYLTGQNIVFHGILGATIGAFVTSFNFVDNKRIIQEIKDHGK
jgi:phytoene dehydrogenase-like protein